MLTLWGRANSSNVMKVLWLLDELGEPYAREDAGGAFGRTREAAYLAMNPNARVPTLVEPDGFALWESNAILRHLAATRAGGERFRPAEPRARARAEQWMDWQLGTLTAPMTTIFFTHVRIPEPERDWPAHDAALAEAGRLWAILDAELGRDGGRGYVCGPGLTLADIALAPYAHRWFALPVARPDLPNLAAWRDRLRERHAGYRAHVEVPLT